MPEEDCPRAIKLLGWCDRWKSASPSERDRLESRAVETAKELLSDSGSAVRSGATDFFWKIAPRWLESGKDILKKLVTNPIAFIASLVLTGILTGWAFILELLQDAFAPVLEIPFLLAEIGVDAAGPLGRNVLDGLGFVVDLLEMAQSLGPIGALVTLAIWVGLLVLVARVGGAAVSAISPRLSRLTGAVTAPLGWFR